MNIKLIHLSFCLIVGISYVSAASVAEVLNSINVVSTITKVKSIIQNKDQEVFKLLERLIETAGVINDKLPGQMHIVDIKIMESTLTILNDLEMTEVHKIIQSFSIATDKIGETINNNNHNSTFMIQYLDEFIQSYQMRNYERMLIKFIDDLTPGSKSLVISFIERLKQKQQSYSSNLNASTNKLVYEFYLSMMLAIGKGHSLLELCYNLKIFYNGEPFDLDLEYLDKRKKKLIENLSKSWKKAVNLSNTINDYVSYYNLIYDVKYVNLLSVLQTHFVYELDFKTCEGTCSDIKDWPMTLDPDCYGSIYYCTSALGVYTKAFKVHSDDQNRIWERYNVGGVWHGRPLIINENFTASRSIVMEDNMYEPKYDDLCEHCRCTCDQRNYRLSVRSFYLRKIEPAQPGFVITGVRFAESAQTIYIQIEVGQLLPMGIINATTVHWQDPPDEMYPHVMSFHYMFRSLHLDILRFENRFLSGVQIYYMNDSLRLGAYSKMFDNFAEGIISNNEVYHSDDKIDPLLNLQDTIPLVSKRPGKIVTNFNRKIVFGTSNQIADAGQSMVPYFDATDITFDLKAPLGGIGLFHHTSDSAYAGYVRPFVSSLNYSDIIEF